MADPYSPLLAAVDWSRVVADLLVVGGVYCGVWIVLRAVAFLYQLLRR